MLSYVLSYHRGLLYSLLLNRNIIIIIIIIIIKPPGLVN